MRTVSVAAVSCLTATLALAQAPTDFPADARPVAADALKERLTGKVFDATLANSNQWRLQYDANGHFFLNIAPSGYADSGKWRTEDSKLCSEPLKTKAGCNEVRLLGETIYLKRDSGEVIKLVAR